MLKRTDISVAAGSERKKHERITGEGGGEMGFFFPQNKSGRPQPTHFDQI